MTYKPYAAILENDYSCNIISAILIHVCMYEIAIILYILGLMYPLAFYEQAQLSILRAFGVVMIMSTTLSALLFFFPPPAIQRGL